MFECENNWDSEDNDLSEALFGNPKPTKPTTKALKETSVNQTTEEKVTRKQWKSRQKNKRRAKKRNQNNNSTNEAPTFESKEIGDVETKEVQPEIKTEAENVTNELSSSISPPEKPQGDFPLVKPQGDFPLVKPQGDFPLVKPQGDFPLVKPQGDFPPVKPHDDFKMKNTSKESNKQEPNKPRLSREQALKRKRLLAMFSDRSNRTKEVETNESKKFKSNDDDQNERLQVTDHDMPSPAVKKELNNNSLKDKLTTKLQGSRFRFINQQMYSCPSKDTVKLLQDDPESFSVYHKGFLAQVAKWPINPLDVIIKWIKARSAKLVIADFGCGEAFLAQSVKNKVHSFDLVALNKHVTVADISNVPLEKDSVDVVVFCLSLMGTNMADFIYEANRVLKLKGVIKIAEVESRFNGHKRFINDIKKFGFTLLRKDTSNNYFHTFDFAKTKNVRKDGTGQGLEHADLQLKPCLYKKR